MDITFLGTTAGVPTRKRGHPAIALRYDNGDVLLFDCGENTQRQLIHAGISPMKIKHIFITHWHADHFAGLPGLLQSLDLRERADPLYIYGPEGTHRFIGLIEMMAHEHPRFEVIANEVEEGEILTEKEYSVYAHKVKHSIPTFAYKFRELNKPGRFDVERATKLGVKMKQFGTLQKGRSVTVGKKKVKPGDVMGEKRGGRVIVYSGDTAALKSMEKFANSADLLIHEGTFSDEMRERAGEVLHSTTKQAAEIAKRAKVKKLIITHISGRYKDSKVLEKEAKKVFKNSEIAEDLMKVEL